MKFSITDIDFFEREVKLRMPFRFGVVTLTQAPQAFVRVSISIEGKRSDGAAAEVLAPKWFDKSPALSNEDNFEQLRQSMRRARAAYLAGGENTAYGHSRPTVGLVENFGPALLDRAVLDALCRALDVSFYEALRRNLPRISFTGLNMNLFLAGLEPGTEIAARHTVGMVDPITSLDNKAPVADGLPETLEEVVARYGHRWFKLKVGGDLQADIERLGAIAAVLDRIREPYKASLDGNEQFEDAGSVTDLWEAVRADPRLKRLASSIVFIEQPIKRQNALPAAAESTDAESGDFEKQFDAAARNVRRIETKALFELLPVPVIIDESDDSLDAFPRAKALGYRGVSSKTCKGLYKSLINAARCRAWGEGYFMTGEDLTIQAGIALQQDLALVSLLGLTHVERNGHHYVNGMAGLPQHEQQSFLTEHQDLYEQSHGAVRVRIKGGMIQMKSLDCPGFASRAMPDWDAMRRMP
jgi:L-alanine-DL-glutamate epimerase-like enolase superfamily enzyme